MNEYMNVGVCQVVKAMRGLQRTIWSFVIMVITPKFSFIHNIYIVPLQDNQLRG